MILDHPSTGPGGGTLRSSLRQWPNNRWVPPERSNQFRRHLVVDLLEDLNINFENSHTRINHKMMGLSIFPRYTNEDEYDNGKIQKHIGSTSRSDVTRSHAADIVVSTSGATQ